MPDSRLDTPDPDDPNAFGDWLRGELSDRRLTVFDLARASGIHRGTIARWMQPRTSDQYRQPRYDSLIQLADTLAVSRETVLDLAGVARPQTPAVTDRQRAVMALIPRLDDDVLAVVEPMLRALVGRETGERVRAALRSESDEPPAQ